MFLNICAFLKVRRYYSPLLAKFTQQITHFLQLTLVILDYCEYNASIHVFIIEQFFILFSSRSTCFGEG